MSADQSTRAGDGTVPPGFTADEWTRYVLRGALQAIEAGATAPLVMNVEGLKDNIRAMLAAALAVSAPAAAVRPDLLKRLRFALGDPDAKLSDSHLTRRAHELFQKAAKWDEWCEAQERVETEMPEGWAYVIQCSPGDWDLYLTDPDGERIPYDSDCDTLAQNMNSAIDEARAARSENPAPATGDKP